MCSLKADWISLIYHRNQTKKRQRDRCSLYYLMEGRRLEGWVDVRFVWTVCQGIHAGRVPVVISRYWTWCKEGRSRSCQTSGSSAAEWHALPRTTGSLTTLCDHCALYWWAVIKYFTHSTVVLQCYRRQAISPAQGKVRPFVTSYSFDWW